MDKQQMKAIVVKYREYLPEPARTLYDVLGFEGLCELSELYGGGTLYISKQASMFTHCMHQSLVDEYDGANQSDLSKKYGVCRRTVYNLVERQMHSKRKRKELLQKPVTSSRA